MCSKFYPSLVTLECNLKHRLKENDDISWVWREIFSCLSFFNFTWLTFFPPRPCLDSSTYWRRSTEANVAHLFPARWSWTPTQGTHSWLASDWKYSYNIRFTSPAALVREKKMWISYSNWEKTTHNELRIYSVSLTSTSVSFSVEFVVLLWYSIDWICNLLGRSRKKRDDVLHILTLPWKFTDLFCILKGKVWDCIVYVWHVLAIITFCKLLRKILDTQYYSCYNLNHEIHLNISLQFTAM